ncbi:MarR family winged helix-turn-helix transcriptional regulator [Corynebacterium sp. H113]|uniref:MarR family winged helix-turn-helix transcriptional regulator n=1 Tax=Corynebacterium sp. H113 TaxID=3133419 RepID=UPI0030A29E2F
MREHQMDEVVDSTKLAGEADANSPAVPWLTEHEQMFWRAVLDAHRAVERLIDTQLLVSSDISNADFSVLVVLSESDKQTMRMRELCEDLDWDRSRMSHQITRMERRGLVEKIRCEKDNRGIDVHLTEHGRELIERAAPGHVRAVRKVLFDTLHDIDLDAAMARYNAVAEAAHKLQAELRP